MTLDTTISDVTIGDGHLLSATHRTVWALGDYALMAEEVMAPLGPILVEATGIGAGARVLDVAAGSGNISLPAAATGAAVVSTDLTQGPRHRDWCSTIAKPMRTRCHSGTASSTS